jgi:serine protease Do
MLHKSPDNKLSVLILGALLFVAASSLHAQGWWQRQPQNSPAPAKGAPAPANTNSSFSPKTDNTPLADRTSLAHSYAPVIEKIAPTVVTITTRERVRRTSTLRHPLLNDPFFRRFFGIPDDEDLPGMSIPPREGLGSGVIMSEDGYIVTNNHVIDGADSITVRVMDGEEYEAKLVGRDPRTDMAVIKIEAKSLPTAVFADSDKVQVGDVVLAIGNPFRLGRTVTKGIVSAIGRDVPLPATGQKGTLITDFIQTDASINPGNSGGALVDSQGRVIGINTAIFTPSGGNVGIGFAVPSNVVLRVVGDLVRMGRVSRGLLGVNIQNINQDMAEALGLQQPRGALVTDVTPGSAAERAGIQPGDLITEFNGTSVRDSRNLQQMVAQQTPGSEVTVKILRNRKEVTLKAKLGDFEEAYASSGGGASGQSSSSSTQSIAGLEVSTISQSMAEQLQLPRGKSGVVVVNIEPGSNAEAAGLQIGDVILVADGQEVTSPMKLLEISRETKRGAMMLRVLREGRQFFVALRLK